MEAERGHCTADFRRAMRYGSICSPLYGLVQRQNISRFKLIGASRPKYCTGYQTKVQGVIIHNIIPGTLGLSNMAQLQYYRHFSVKTAVREKVAVVPCKNPRTLNFAPARPNLQDLFQGSGIIYNPKGIGFGVIFAQGNTVSEISAGEDFLNNGKSHRESLYSSRSLTP